MKYYLIAGERSGDLHGSNLVRYLKSFDNAASFRGFGGDEMGKQGMQLAIHYRDLAFMAIGEVIMNLRRILGIYRFCKRDILKYNPDVLILIDYGGFNMRIARFAKAKNIKVFYYISPKIWAWNQSRAKKIKRNVDRMFVILPFERSFYERFDYRVDYVGNPLIDSIHNYQFNDQFISHNNLPTDKKIIALLPGSRQQELIRILPLMKEVASRRPDFHFVVAGVNSLPEKMYEGLTDIPNLSIVFEQTYDLLKNAYGAIVASGTATLETALLGVPQIVVYKMSGLNYFIGKRVVSVKYISLVNLIAGNEVVKELIQEQMNLEEVLKEFDHITAVEESRNKQLEQYERVKKLIGPNSASQKAAELMVNYLRKV